MEEKTVAEKSTVLSDGFFTTAKVTENSLDHYSESAHEKVNNCITILNQ